MNSLYQKSQFILLVCFLGYSLGTPLPVNAETCQPLDVVGGTGTTQTKTVTPPSVPFVPFIPFASFSNNWNTDFFVPGGKYFRRYMAEIKPEDDVTYGIEFNLKYSNNTFDNFFKQTVPIKKNQTYRVSGTPRPNSAPYQVNVLVGGLDNATSTTYKLTVYGCN